MENIKYLPRKFHEFMIGIDISIEYKPYYDIDLRSRLKCESPSIQIQMVIADNHDMRLLDKGIHVMTKSPYDILYLISSLICDHNPHIKHIDNDKISLNQIDHCTRDLKMWVYNGFFVSAFAYMNNNAVGFIARRVESDDVIKDLFGKIMMVNEKYYNDKLQTGIILANEDAAPDDITNAEIKLRNHKYFSHIIVVKSCQNSLSPKQIEYIINNPRDFSLNRTGISYMLSCQTSCCAGYIVKVIN